MNIEIITPCDACLPTSKAVSELDDDSAGPGPLRRVELAAVPAPPNRDELAAALSSCMKKEKRPTRGGASSFPLPAAAPPPGPALERELCLPAASSVIEPRSDDLRSLFWPLNWSLGPPLREEFERRSKPEGPPEGPPLGAWRLDNMGLV